MFPEFSCGSTGILCGNAVSWAVAKLKGTIRDSVIRKELNKILFTLTEMWVDVFIRDWLWGEILKRCVNVCKIVEKKDFLFTKTKKPTRKLPSSSHYSPPAQTTCYSQPKNTKDRSANSRQHFVHGDTFPYPDKFSLDFTADKLGNCTIFNNCIFMMDL